MIRRVVVVPMKLDRAKLRVDNDEVLRESVPAQQAAGFARTRRRAVQKVRQVRGFPVGDPLIGCRELPQRFRAAAVLSDGDGSDADASQHRVEQRRVASGARDVERIEDAVLGDIDRVEFFGGPELGPFTADITDLHRQVPYQFLLDRQVPVLDVGHHTIVGESLQPRDAVREGDRLQRPDAARRQRKYGQGRPNVQVLRRCQHAGRQLDR